MGCTKYKYYMPFIIYIIIYLYCINMYVHMFTLYSRGSCYLLRPGAHQPFISINIIYLDSENLKISLSLSLSSALNPCPYVRETRAMIIFTYHIYIYIYKCALQSIFIYCILWVRIHTVAIEGLFDAPLFKRALAIWREQRRSHCRALKLLEQLLAIIPGDLGRLVFGVSTNGTNFMGG